MSGDPIGIIAGGGDLPKRLVQHVALHGGSTFVLGISGYAENEFLDAIDGVEVSIGEIGRQVSLLKKAGCKRVAFAGLVRRPDFSKLRLDIKGTASLPKLLSAATKGDDALLRAVLEIFEGEGFEVLGVEEIFGGLMVSAGPLGSVTPTELDWADIKCAARAALELGSLDIGQGAVSCRSLILAVEAQEGTDLMLERCAQLPANIRGCVDNRAGVLVKRPKPQQDMRIDLPTIGVATVRRASAAGLSGIALEEGGALIVDRDAVIALADEMGIFLLGFSAEEVA